MTERDLHDMGGDIGPASLTTAQSDGDGDDAGSGYARTVFRTAGSDESDPYVAGPQESGSAAAAPVATTRGDYLAIDDADNLGRGADGETAARIEQRDDGDL